jgi:hypothetical protein
VDGDQSMIGRAVVVWVGGCCGATGADGPWQMAINHGRWLALAQHVLRSLYEQPTVGVFRSMRGIQEMHCAQKIRGLD